MWILRGMSIAIAASFFSVGMGSAQERKIKRSDLPLAALSQLQTFLGFFALIFIVKACVFIGGLPENGRVETKCLPFDNGLLAVCR